jgi:DMSO/TMAO reductase YedYZ heme-binding membrane subunit
MSVLATTGPSALWYLARGSGLAALVVLTLSMVLGLLTSVRWTNSRWPRFVIELVHRNSSLVAFVLIVVHIATVVIDAFAPIGWKDAVIPFVSVYRPVWLGLGAAAFDVLVALTITSLLRHRMRHRTWRFIHWFAYLCWPLVVVHGLGTGSDAKVGFVLLLYVACIAAVIMAGWWRLAVGWPDHVGVRIGGAVASVVGPIVLLVWLASGPLAAGWARRAGTPASVLAKLTPSAAVASTPPSSPTTSAPPPSSGSLPAPPFSAQLTGTTSQSNPAADGRVTVRLATTLSGGAAGVLNLNLIGKPVEGGGVLLDTSQVTLGPSQQPNLYQGSVVALAGARITADLQSAGRPPLELVMTVQIDPTGAKLTGSLRAQTGGSGGAGGGGGGDGQ